MSRESSSPKGDAAEKHAEDTKPAPGAEEAADAAEPAAPAEADVAGEEPAPTIDVTLTEPIDEPAADDAPADEAPADEAPQAAASKPPEPLNVTSNLPPRAWPPRVVADSDDAQGHHPRRRRAGRRPRSWMQRFRFRHLPVVNGGKLVGLITRVDFLHAALGRGPSGEPIPKLEATTPASAIIDKSVATAQMDAPLTTAGRVMLTEKLGCLPVLLPDGTLVGIVTESDFARLALDVLERVAAR